MLHPRPAPHLLRRGNSSTVVSLLSLSIAIIACGCRVNSAPTEQADAVGATVVVSGPSASGPHLTKSDSDIYISWTEKDSLGATFMFSQWLGDEWATPKTIASGSNWFVNWADVPSLSISENSNLTAHWLEKTGESTYAYGIRIASSADNGSTWSDPRWLQDDLSDTEHGFAILEPIGGNRLLGTWLDGRKYATGENEMSLISRILRPDGTLGNEVVVDDLVCDCCPMSSASNNGRVLIAYRNRTPEEVRDIYSAYYDGEQWSEPTNVNADGWTIAGCPVNGPSIDMNSDGSSIAWFTAAGDLAKVMTSFGSAQGAEWTPPVRIDLGNPVGRVDITHLRESEALVLWMENDQDGAADLLIRLVDDQGISEPMLITKMSSKRGSGLPKMIATDTSVIVAWTDSENESRIVSRMIPLSSLPTIDG